MKVSESELVYSFLWKDLSSPARTCNIVNTKLSESGAGWGLQLQVDLVRVEHNLWRLNTALSFTKGHFGIRHIEYYLFKCNRDIRELIKQSQDQTCRCVILYDPQELVWSKTICV